MNQQVDHAWRRMPDPWFRAQVVSSTIRAVIKGEPTRLLREGERRLGPFILPPFQRPPVWTREQQNALIQSIWDGLPIGSYVLNQTCLGDHCDNWILDGQQRITAIIAYANGDFSVYGHRFPDLHIGEQRGFLLRPIGTLLTQLTDDAQCRLVYDRLAHGGTPHSPKPAERKSFGPAA